MNNPLLRRQPDQNAAPDTPGLSPAISARAAQRAQRWQRALLHGMRKVPEVTVFFWIIKLLTTAMGESTSDYLVFQINPYVAVVLGCLGLAIALILQLWVRRYIPSVYWLTVVMVAIFGTMAADVAHVVLGIPYLVSSDQPLHRRSPSSSPSGMPARKRCPSIASPGVGASYFTGPPSWQPSRLALLWGI